MTGQYTLEEDETLIDINEGKSCKNCKTKFEDGCLAWGAINPVTDENVYFCRNPGNSASPCLEQGDNWGLCYRGTAVKIKLKYRSASKAD